MQLMESEAEFQIRSGSNRMNVKANKRRIRAGSLTQLPSRQLRRLTIVAITVLVMIHLLFPMISTAAEISNNEKIESVDFKLTEQSKSSEDISGSDVPPMTHQEAKEESNTPLMENVSLTNTAFVLGVSLLGVLASEGLAWVFVYRTEEYGLLLNGVINSWRKLQEAKDPRRRTGAARIKMQETVFQERNQKLGSKRMKAGILSSVIYLFLLPSFKRSFHGIAVLFLPFEPIWFVRSLALHSLPQGSEVLRHGSAMFLYVLAVGFFRTNIQKLMGYAPPASIAAGTGLAGWLSQPSETTEDPSPIQHSPAPAGTRAKSS